MFNTKCKMFLTVLLVVFANALFAQKNIGSMLQELVGDYSTPKEGTYTFAIADGGATVKYYLKQFDYSSSSKGMYCCMMVTPIYVFNKNFRPSEELLSKISEVNSNLSPGTLTFLGTDLYYLSYFWDSELNTTVLGYEIATAFYNTVSLQKDFDTFMSK